MGLWGGGGGGGGGGCHIKAETLFSIVQGFSY